MFAYEMQCNMTISKYSHLEKEQKLILSNRAKTPNYPMIEYSWNVIGLHDLKARNYVSHYQNKIM